MPFPVIYSGTQKRKNPSDFPLKMIIHPPKGGWPERKVLWDSPYIFVGPGGLGLADCLYRNARMLR